MVRKHPPSQIYIFPNAKVSSNFVRCFNSFRSSDIFRRKFLKGVQKNVRKPPINAPMHYSYSIDYLLRAFYYVSSTWVCTRIRSYHCFTLIYFYFLMGIPQGSADVSWSSYRSSNGRFMVFLFTYLIKMDYACVQGHVLMGNYRKYGCDRRAWWVRGFNIIDFIATVTGGDRPTLRDLIIHVIPSITTKWFEIGVVLLDPKYQNELSTIEVDTRNDAATCCRKMFSKWLNTDELASWDKLINALRIVQLNNVAGHIEQLLLQGEYVTHITDVQK